MAMMTDRHTPIEDYADPTGQVWDVPARVSGVIAPLAWEDLGADYWRADAPLFGSIRVEPWGDRGFQVLWSVPGACDRLIPDLSPDPEAAKAAAQADYEQRIRSCIIPAPAVSLPEDVAWLVNELNAILDQAHADLDEHFRDVEYTGERPDLQDSETMIAVDLVERLRSTIDALSAENARLTNRAEVAEYKRHQAVNEIQPMIIRRAEKAEAALARLTERDKMLTEALRPFANYMHPEEGRMDQDNHGNDVPDDLGVGWIYLTHGDFRRARAALADASKG